MSSNCFVRQEATPEIIKNVANFCASCYDEIQEESIIFYDMQKFCYLCESCQSRLEETLDDNGGTGSVKSSSLFQ